MECSEDAATPQPILFPAMPGVTRRIAAAWLAAGLCVSIARAAAPDDPVAASRFVQQAGTELATIMNSAASDDEKQQRMQAFIDRVADVDSVARFSLGRYWPQATPAQRQEFTRLFHTVLVNSVSGESHQYEQQTSVATQAPAEARADGMHVTTTVARGGAPPFHVTWVVGYDTGSPKIIDVIAEGISLRVTQRSDYVSFLSRNGGNIDALIKAVRQQLRLPSLAR
jgi:phospholipid transport system substrate-binding protein